MNPHLDALFASEPLSRSAEQRLCQILHAGGLHQVLLVDADADPDLIELLRCGLLAPLDVHEGRPPLRIFVAVDPRHAQARWAARLRDSAAEHLDSFPPLPSDVDRLAVAFDQRQHPVGPAPGFELVVGRRTINQRIGQIVAGCTLEALTLRPDASPPAVLRGTLMRDIETARRITWRTLYSSELMAHSDARDYVGTMSQVGAVFRTSSSLTSRLLVLDRATAVIAAESVDDERAACFITDPPTVAYLRRYFFRLWDAAEPWSAEVPNAVDVSDVQRAIADRLVLGLDQVDIARDLGMNERTCAGHVAQLKARFGVSTLFELGAALARNECR